MIHSLIEKESIYHGCTNCANLEMEPKYLMKSDAENIYKDLENKNDKTVL